MKRTLLIGIMAGMSMNGWTSESGGESPAEAVLSLDRPLVIAHRGYSEIAPENTLQSFALGVTSGADLVELDYHVTREGTEIVIHDATLDRTTDAVARWGEVDIAVSKRSLEALQALDAGSWFGPGFAGEKLPTLVESIELIHGKGGVTLVERKAGPAASFAKVLRERGWVNELIVQAFDWEYLAAMNKELPEQVLGALGPAKERHGRRLSREERELSPEWIDEAMKAGARVVGWNRYVNEEAVRYAHEKGLKVWVYTINDAEQATKLMEMGVDGIITNNPSIVWKAQALQGG